MFIKTLSLTILPHTFFTHSVPRIPDILLPESLNEA